MRKPLYRPPGTLTPTEAGAEALRNRRRRPLQVPQLVYDASIGALIGPEMQAAIHALARKPRVR